MDALGHPAAAGHATTGHAGAAATDGFLQRLGSGAVMDQPDSASHGALPRFGSER